MPSLTSPVRPSYDEPATAEDAVLMTLARLGRRLRQRMPGEQLELTAILLLKVLLHEGPLRPSALADALGVDASTVSRQVRHLEDRGLLERTADPDDRRASRLALSEEGRARLEEGAQCRRALVADLLESWSDEDRDRLKTLLTRLHTDLEHHHRGDRT